MRCSSFCVLFVALTWSAALPAADKIIPRNATIYIEEMEDDFDGYLRAEFVKKKIPLKILLSAEGADLILTGTATKEEKRPWHEGWLTSTKDHTTSNIMIVDPKTNQMIWASEAGDRSLSWGAFRRSGPRKVADRLANNIKKIIRDK